MDNIISVKNLTAKVKLNNGDYLTTVDDVSLTLVSKKSYAIVGKSGSGKTSLISIIGLLNSSYVGELKFNDIDIQTLNDSKLSQLRNEKIGFVFQNYSLIKHLNVYENIELPLLYSKNKLNKKERKQRILEVLNQVELSDRIYDKTNTLSGGEQQRISIARALVLKPELIICDEPTGALDVNTGEMIIELLLKLVKEEKTSLLLVTHDLDIASKCDVKFLMEKGKICLK